MKTPNGMNSQCMCVCKVTPYHDYFKLSDYKSKLKCTTFVHLGLFRFETQSASACGVGHLKMLTTRLLLLTYNTLESIFIVCVLNLTSLHFKLAFQNHTLCTICCQWGQQILWSTVLSASPCLNSYQTCWNLIGQYNMDYKSLQMKTKKATNIFQMKIFAYRANMCMFGWWR